MNLCGIVACLLNNGKVAPVIHEALKRLEYRGYDSVGIATIDQENLYVKKDVGKIDDVHKVLNLDDLPGRAGVGHCRWATHGAPLKVNAHPHVDCGGKIAVVHNGIIENFTQLRDELTGKGHVFVSKTDTEVIPHLIEEGMNTGLSFIDAFKETLNRLEGSYAIAAIYIGEVGKIFCARNESPLVVGVGNGSLCVASDIPAILNITNTILDVNNGELLELSDQGFKIWRLSDGSRISREPYTISWTVEMAEKKGYPHFMIKEIHEQPISLNDALRTQEKYLELLSTFLDRSKEIFLLACGTSYNACLAASYMFSSLANLPTYPVIASEFEEQYGESVNIASTILAVSQSGETADVLHAIDQARFKAATILGLTNAVGSTLTRVSRTYICQQSGPEIGVAATKTFTAQMIVLAQLGLRLAKVRGKISQERIDFLEAKLRDTPKIIGQIISSQEENIQQIARKYKDAECFYFLGRGISTATALEGRLKLLEISYIPCIAYPAGESKHGPISLVKPGFPVIFICPPDHTHKTVIGNIMEMKARGARIITIIESGDKDIMKLSDNYIEIPEGIPDVLSPISYIVPLQLFAYYMALEKGLNPDMPRNLAKSVTVL
ncbi:MAG: glutamine--fructose-6-phosphate transaminase (isomerizing) [Candidatus Bathyarchaeota archaeon]